MIREGAHFRVIVKTTGENVTDDVVLKALLWMRRGSDNKRDYKGKML
jgi:hypothetical protein